MRGDVVADVWPGLGLEPLDGHVGSGGLLRFALNDDEPGYLVAHGRVSFIGDVVIEQDRAGRLSLRSKRETERLAEMDFRSRVRVAVGLVLGRG